MGRERDARGGSIGVWDRCVRLSHWTIAIAVLVTYYTHGGLLYAHRVAGYTIVALVIARLVWGCIGSPYARFSDFVAAPHRVARHLAALVRGRDLRFIGHNPAGGAMILVLWSLLLALGGTGWMLDSPQYRDYRPLLEAHTILSNVLLVLIAVHIIGVLLASWRHRENLILAMLTGRKRGPRAGD